MFSADFMPCTLTFPLISLAFAAPANASVRPATTAVCAATRKRLMTFLSFQVSPAVRSLKFKLWLSLEDVVDSGLERVWTEKQGISCRGIRERPSKRVLIF